MSQETVEYLLRQKSKVKNPKSLVKVVRAHTRELKRARKKETEVAVFEAAKELIRATGGVAQGFAGGAVTGPALLIIGLAYAGQLGLLNPIYDIASRVAKAIGDGFKTGAVTNFTRDVIDDVSPDIIVISGGTGGFCFTIGPLVPFIPLLFGPTGEVCFSTAAARDDGVRLVKDKLGPLAALYTIRVVNK